MTYKPIIIVSGEPFSIFLEIFFKSLKDKEIKKIKNPIIIICSKNLLLSQMKKMNFRYQINSINLKKIKFKKMNNKKINLIDVNFNFNKPFAKISSKSREYISKSIDIALDLIKEEKIKILINGPISKPFFLNKKFPGMTEYFSYKTKCTGKEVMLIYNKNLSVSPLTTHVPLKKVFKNISKEKLIKQIITINNFYKKNLKIIPKIAVTGLNPHCESTDSISEEEKIIKPAIKILKKNKIKIFGPFPADTIFLKRNYKNFNTIVGMYHDQVLVPIKTIYSFKAINITLGLPFLRVTPDHGTNNQMIGKNLSSPISLIESILFAKKISDN